MFVGFGVGVRVRDDGVSAGDRVGVGVCLSALVSVL